MEKHKIPFRPRSFLCLSLALLLAFGAAAADTAFSFRNGITWSTAPAQMLFAEGLGESGVNQHSDRGYSYYYLKGQDVYYVFRGEQLVQAYAVLPGGAYAGELERLSAQYGPPAEGSADRVAALWNTLVPGGLSPEMLGALSTWKLSDGTLAALFAADGKTCAAYFHEQRILGGQ